MICDNRRIPLFMGRTNVDIDEGELFAIMGAIVAE